MKWVLMLLVFTGPEDAYQKDIPGWSTEVLCKQAAANIEAKHPITGHYFPKVAALCAVQPSAIVLPTPR